MGSVWLSNRQRGEVGLWSLGYAMFTIGALLSMMRDTIPDPFSIIIGNALVIGAQGIHWLGYRQFTHGDARRRFWPILIAPGLWLAFATLGVGYDNINSRIFFFSAMMMANSLAIPIGLWRHHALEPLPALKPIAIITLIHCLALGLRLVLLSVKPLPPHASPFSGVLPVEIAILEAMLYVIFTGTLQMALIGQRAERRFRIASETDELTGLWNRRYFLSRITRALQEAAGRGALLVFDLDQFKLINDQHGHGAGDNALIAFANCVRRNIGSDDLFARSGGEEFVLFLPRSDVAEAQAVARRICRDVADMRIDFRNGVSGNITTSCGIATVADSGTDYDILFADADWALYQAKRSGRNCVRVSGSIRNRRPQPVLVVENQETAVSMLR